MNIKQANNPEAEVLYVGKCKNNTAPKHINGNNVISKKMTIIEPTDDKPIKHKVIAYDSPKTVYTYIKHGSQWLWVKAKAQVMMHDTFDVVKITRKPNAVPAKPEGN